MEKPISDQNARSTIVFVQFTSPAAFTILGTAARFLASHGWDVLFLGVRSHGSSDMLKMSSHTHIEQSCLAYQVPGFRQKFNYLLFSGMVFWTVLKRRPIVLYCSDSIAAPAVLLSNYFFSIPVIYHEHDPPEIAATAFGKFVAVCRRKLVSRAILCVVPSQGRHNDFIRSLAPKNSMMIWNGVSLSEVESEAKLKPRKGLNIWFQGSINKVNLPESIIDAIALVPGVVLKFAGYEAGGGQGYRQALLAKAQRLRVADRVFDLGVISTREALCEASNYSHVGLALFEIGSREMAGASQKPFEYLARGMALLVPDILEWQEFVIEKGLGRGCLPSSPQSIAAQLRWFSENLDMTIAMGEKGRQRVESDWNYEKLFRPVVAVLDALPKSYR